MNNNWHGTTSLAFRSAAKVRRRGGVEANQSVFRVL